MATAAFSLALEDRLATCSVRTGGQRLVTRGGQRAQISNNGSHLRFRHRLGWHARTRNTVAQNLDNVVVGLGAREFRVTEIHAGDLVPVGAVTVNAVGDIQPLADFNIGLRVLRGSEFVLGRKRTG